MYAVEFETKIENGIVNIPKEYSDIYQSQARVLVLVDEVVKKTEKKDYAAFFNELRNRHIKVSSEVDIDGLMNEMNELIPTS
jgi:hypothetical protein